jgi:predicted DNA-binding protein
MTVPSVITTAVAARIPNEHAAKIAALAQREAATTSSIIATIIAERFDDQPDDDHKTQ